MELQACAHGEEGWMSILPRGIHEEDSLVIADVLGKPLGAVLQQYLTMRPLALLPLGGPDSDGELGLD